MGDVTRVLILGSTGSIGTQALQVVAEHPDDFEVVGIAAGGGNTDLLADQARSLGLPASAVAVADPDAASVVDERLGGRGVLSGPEALTELIETVPADVILNGVVGSLGLASTLAALKTGTRLALANKESLVAGGSLVLDAAAEGQIVPVDSEHSAIAQCLRAGSADEVDRLVLTASGGPFRGYTPEQLQSVTPEQAGHHPTWSMGPMITLNSATLVNKGLEVIEAHLLFGVPYSRIDVTVHPQSVVHSMVTFVDGATVAKASPPSMKLPIALALGWPHRVGHASVPYDFSTASAWTFEPVDSAAFPAIDLARAAGEAGGSRTAVYNAANEAAAAQFFAGRISFPQITATIEAVLADSDEWSKTPGTVDEVLAADAWARRRARDVILAA
ncbi:1-deoxy-D-xylulose-5-phosphate reductoisomerase [Gordonia jinhuaensis]|uniref:1-deoxy-D-xylulose 5-phosphate reductoisomerase n=1 Tax=Gordonia jinhuaensis TaxID=1517702 RepID=A0A916T3C6_9ACTN|nr:1-deoxy-D-xylulose-5-phosphate reductoisomerase [Gordonia jinhuaensis]GGB26947.1 1-deoxy-D-xylulose 5-phosphate reductoisomerase [Gordonia jinhuaensis]